MQKQPTEKFCKKPVLQNFAIFAGKHLCWRLSLVKNTANFFRAPILKNICKWLLLKMFMKLKKVKNFGQGILTLQKTQDFSTSVLETSVKCISLCFYFIIGFPWNLKLHKYFFNVVRNKPLTINIYVRVDKKKIKSSRKKYVISTYFKF